jgi:hypothetical protein
LTGSFEALVMKTFLGAEVYSEVSKETYEVVAVIGFL